MIRNFRAKPVTVEAIKWTGQNLVEIQHFCNGLAHYNHATRKLSIETREGTSPATVGDFIVRGTLGEFYPVKPDVMFTKYDELESGS